MAKKNGGQMTAQGHGYLITVKGHQPTLPKSIARTAQSPATEAWSWRQTGHGHDTRCRLKCWPAEEAMKAQWPGLEQYLSVRRQGERNGQAFDSTTYYITSEPLSAWCLAQRVRGHRKIENTLHWTKDVVLQEDDCGLVNSQAAAHRAVIRNISFNLRVMAGYRSISEGISAMGEQVSKLWHLISQPNRKSLKR